MIDFLRHTSPNLKAKPLATILIILDAIFYGGMILLLFAL